MDDTKSLLLNIQVRVVKPRDSMESLPPQSAWNLKEALSHRSPVVVSDALKWARFYWDFCLKYGHNPRADGSLPLFQAKLAQKRQAAESRTGAAGAVKLLLKVAETDQSYLSDIAPPSRGLPQRTGAFDASLTCDAAELFTTFTRFALRAPLARS